MKTITNKVIQRNKKAFLGKINTAVLILIVFILPRIVTANIPSLPVDIAVFKSDIQGMSDIEIYCQISNKILQFVKTDNGYSAFFEISMVLIDSSGDLVESIFYEDSILVNSYDETISNHQVQFIKFNITVAPGKYDLQVELSGNEFQKIAITKKKVKIRKFDNIQLSLSDIQIANEIASEDQKSSFSKNGRNVIQNPTRIFGTSDGNIVIYFEVYNLSNSTTDSLGMFCFNYVLKNNFNKKLDFAEYESRKPGTSASVSFNISPENLQAGDYKIEINVIDNDNNTKVSKTSGFSIWRSPLSLKYNDYDSILEQLSFIADHGEIDKMRKVPVSGRQQTLVDFWAKRDPTPGTKRNELMDEFSKRLIYASQHFGFGNWEGWRTDRGRIYISFGSPNYVTRQYLDNGSGSLEIWHYQKNNKAFQFIDRFGFGEYRLIRPNHFALMWRW